jgi:crotonobetainyl-CoA:carnitine CoA-transferase CaiB-like acyl-CoA transferase
VGYDLASGPAAEWLDQLLDRADGLIGDPTFRIGDSGLPELSSHHPHLVVLSTSAFGAAGPWSGRSGSGRVAEAFGGQTFAAGDPTRSPLHAGLPIGAATTSLFGALGVVAGVLERDRHGHDLGQLIDLAGYEAVLRGMEFLPIFFQQIGFRNERSGIGSSYQVPVATWRTADDKWVTFTGNTNEVVHRLYRAMGRAELIDDPRFATNDGRVAHRGVVEATMAEWAGSLSRAALEEVCRQHHVPVGAVLSMQDIFEEPNYLERQTIAEVTDTELGPCRLPSVVPRFSRTPGRVDHLGQSGPHLNPAVEDLWGPRTPAPSTGGASPPAVGPLAGLRVIDMGQILAGPYAATVLADLGADVIKVEKPMLGDDFRRQAPLHRGVSLWWKASARNKRSIALDLKDPSDHAAFVDLVAQADVITANFVPGTLERLGLGYDALRAINPGIVLVSVSGYGQHGRYRTRRAFGRNAEAYGGLSYITGYRDSPPMPTGFPVADGLSATLGAFGALCALYARRCDAAGGGQQVDVALYETVFRLVELPALMYDQLGVVAGPSEEGTTVGEQICVARSADGRWVSASKWSTAGRPLTAPDEIGAIRDHIESHTSHALMAEDSPLGFALAPVSCVEELGADAHCQARSSIVRVADDELGEVALAGIVPRFARTPGRISHASPKLDEHHAEIVRQWGKRPSGPRWEQRA